jgi:hypothetical protein
LRGDSPVGRPGGEMVLVILTCAIVQRTYRQRNAEGQIHLLCDHMHSRKGLFWAALV